MKRTLSILFTLLLCLNLAVPAFAADTCIVAGVSALCGSAWQPDDPNNAMTLKGNVFEKVYHNVPVGSYEFKTVYNGAWLEGANLAFSVVTPCDVTITYDPSSGIASYSGSGIGKATLQVTALYVAGEEALCGTFWEANTPANQMTKGADGIYTKTFKNVAKGTYQLKVTDGTWDNCWGGDGPDGNFQFTTEAGDVTVKFDPATQRISVFLSKGPEPQPTDPTDPGPAPAEGYFVAGEEALCGTLWEANTPANEMKKDADGIYTKTFKNVAKGTYQLKVTDGTWDNSWGGDGPEGNFQFTTEAGDVTVKFDPATKLISVVLPEQPEPQPTVPSGPKYYVSGNCKAMGNWDAAPAQCLMRLRADGSYSIVFKNLPAGKYEFKVTDGTWNNSWGENGQNKTFELKEAADVGIYFTLKDGQGHIDVELNPDTDDFSLFPTVAAALCVTVCGCLLLMNKKKLI